MKKTQKTPTKYDVARLVPSIFATIVRPKFEIVKHLTIIDDKLAQTVYGDIQRLIITMPRRHGKTFLTSETFPLWFIAVNELRGRPVEVAVVSYNQSKACDISRSIRDLFNHPDFNKVFPNTKLKDGNESVEQWSTELGSKFYATGVGGSLTGRGCHLLILDDCFKNAEEALSANRREHIKEWYRTAAFNSVYEDGVIVHIGTRWHSDDLIGHVLANDEKVQPEYRENWTVIHQQAIIDEGTDNERPLWPRNEKTKTGFTLQYLKRIRETQGHRWWSTQYRGIPIDTSEGTLGHPRRGTPTPDKMPTKLFGYIDTAFDGMDSTAFVIGGVIPGTDEVYIAYADVKRKNSVEWSPQIATIMKQYDVRSCLVEKNADKGWTGKEIMNNGVHVIHRTTTKNKVGRIQSWVGNKYKNLLFDERCTPEFIALLSSWSELSAHDDCADAVAGLVEFLLDKARGVQPLSPDFFRG